MVQHMNLYDNEACYIKSGVFHEI